jgi:DNA-binding response OmpR family regulator
MANIKTVLCIDDNEDIRKLLKKFLSSAGINSIAFGSSKEALDYLKDPASLADLVILDLSMPDINGFQFLELVANTRKIRPFKVCILTGAKEKELVAKAIALKADDYIVKPIDKPILLNKIRALLGVQSVELSKFAFAKVDFQATLLNLPVLLNFSILGISEEGLLIESVCNFREQAVVNFKSRGLSDAIEVDEEFSIKINKTKFDKTKFQISAVFMALPEGIQQKIRAFAAQNAQNSISMFT